LLEKKNLKKYNRKFDVYNKVSGVKKKLNDLAQFICTPAALHRSFKARV
jgi:hypothetical protein